MLILGVTPHMFYVKPHTYKIQHLCRLLGEIFGFIFFGHIPCRSGVRMDVPPTENGNDSYKATFYNLSGCWSLSEPPALVPQNLQFSCLAWRAAGILQRMGLQQSCMQRCSAVICTHYPISCCRSGPLPSHTPVCRACCSAAVMTPDITLPMLVLSLLPLTETLFHPISGLTICNNNITQSLWEPSYHHISISSQVISFMCSSILSSEFYFLQIPSKLPRAENEIKSAPR